MIKNFDSWKEYEGASEGSGRSEKIWLVNPINGDIGLFKFNKSEFTTENLSEKISSDIASLIGFECMKVDLGKYDGRLGSLGYKINNIDESLVEGIRLINNYYPSYNPNNLYDEVNKEYYSLEMILKSLTGYEFYKDFFRIPVFDFLIGNTDRHQNNWGIIQKEKDARLCPLYDNGSSLCSYILEENIDSFLGKDIVRFNSLVNTKSTSRIRIDKYKKKEPSHLEVLKFLHDHYYSEIFDIVKIISYNVNEHNIQSILESYLDVMSDKKRALVKKFLLEKVSLIKKQFNL